MIYETIITTQALDGRAHVAPFGVRWQDEYVLISPYRPSITLQNILETGFAVMNITDDMLVFASAIVKKKYFNLLPADHTPCLRLANVLAHYELVLQSVIEDEIRPQLVMKVKHSENHASFKGFNRAQAAVIELAVLASRLDRLPIDEIMANKQFLQIAIDKTAGKNELLAWQSLCKYLESYSKKTTYNVQAMEPDCGNTG